MNSSFLLLEAEVKAEMGILWQDFCYYSSVSNYFYYFLVVDGGFSEWGEWDECSATCDEGVMTRERVCDNPEPQGQDAKDCRHLGSYTEIKKCHLKDCNGKSSV